MIRVVMTTAALDLIDSLMEKVVGTLNCFLTKLFRLESDRVNDTNHHTNHLQDHDKSQDEYRGQGILSR